MAHDLSLSIRTLSCALALLAPFASGCVTSPAFSKDEGRARGGLTDTGDDICELEGWYDDGECDDFCVELDSDCGATCEAIPVCLDHETEHASESECPQDAACRPVTLCGTTIWCAEALATCQAYPSCDDGETEHAREADCPADTSCRAVEVCGYTVWCSSGGTCSGPNPQGCVSSGCAEGWHCDTTTGSAPSACGCDPENGTWICTADLNGGVCVED